MAPTPASSDAGASDAGSSDAGGSDAARSDAPGDPRALETEAKATLAPMPPAVRRVRSWRRHVHQHRDRSQPLRHVLELSREASARVGVPPPACSPTCVTDGLRGCDRLRLRRLHQRSVRFAGLSGRCSDGNVSARPLTALRAPAPTERALPRRAHRRARTAMPAAPRPTAALACAPMAPAPRPRARPRARTAPGGRTPTARAGSVRRVSAPRARLTATARRRTLASTAPAPHAARTSWAPAWRTSPDHLADHDHGNHARAPVINQRVLTTDGEIWGLAQSSAGAAAPSSGSTTTASPTPSFTTTKAVNDGKPHTVVVSQHGTFALGKHHGTVNTSGQAGADEPFPSGLPSPANRDRRVRRGRRDAGASSGRHGGLLSLEPDPSWSVNGSYMTLNKATREGRLARAQARRDKLASTPWSVVGIPTSR